MDALTLLTADHNRVRGLFARFTTARESDDAATMIELGEHIDRELTVHADVEETVFYPWARELSNEIATVVDEGIEEHHVVKVLLAEIAGLEPGADDWTAKLTVVAENVEHHAGEEEDEMFPQVSSASSSKDLHRIADQLEARKSDLGGPTA